jgi:hypothetical protein
MPSVILTSTAGTSQWLCSAPLPPVTQQQRLSPRLSGQGQGVVCAARGASGGAAGLISRAGQTTAAVCAQPLLRLRAHLPGRFHPEFRDKNRRGIGESQPKWAAYKMETPGSRRAHAQPTRASCGSRGRSARRTWRQQPDARVAVRRRHAWKADNGHVSLARCAACHAMLPTTPTGWGGVGWGGINSGGGGWASSLGKLDRVRHLTLEVARGGPAIEGRPALRRGRADQDHGGPPSRERACEVRVGGVPLLGHGGQSAGHPAIQASPVSLGIRAGHREGRGLSPHHAWHLRHNLHLSELSEVSAGGGGGNLGLGRRWARGRGWRGNGGGSASAGAVGVAAAALLLDAPSEASAHAGVACGEVLERRTGRHRGNQRQQQCSSSWAWHRAHVADGWLPVPVCLAVCALLRHMPAGMA